MSCLIQYNFVSVLILAATIVHFVILTEAQVSALYYACITNAKDLMMLLSYLFVLKKTVLHLSSYREYSLTELQPHSCSHDLTESI